MSTYDTRAKGKRFRKPQSGGSNAKERWKYLSAQTDDVVHEKSAPAARLKPALAAAVPTKLAQTSTRQHDRLAATAPMRLGYDIDGDGQIDVREMRLAKVLDALIESRHHQLSPEQQPPSERELSRMRQEAGRLLIAKEFVERNHDRLWRYGAVFAGKSEEQGAEFIATHKNFQKLMPFLENLERKRTIRSSQNLRECMHHRENSSSGSSDASSSSDAQLDARLVRQTWIETSRKVPDAAFSSHPLPELQPRKKALNVGSHPEVTFNMYGAIDVDGDGIVDDDEMKISLRLQEATLDTVTTNSSSQEATNTLERRQLQQQEGRRLMAKDFVERNKQHLRLFEPSFRGKTVEQVAEAIAANTQFAKEFNRLRAKERVLRLKSSDGVSGCLEQAIAAELRADPTNATEFRRVRHRSELLLARRELLKPHELQTAVGGQQRPLGVPQLRAVREARAELSRTQSDPYVAGLPKLFETPVRIEATGSFSVTKWKWDS